MFISFCHYETPSTKPNECTVYDITWSSFKWAFSDWLPAKCMSIRLNLCSTHFTFRVKVWTNQIASRRIIRSNKVMWPEASLYQPDAFPVACCLDFEILILLLHLRHILHNSSLPRVMSLTPTPVSGLGRGADREDSEHETMYNRNPRSLKWYIISTVPQYWKYSGRKCYWFPRVQPDKQFGTSGLRTRWYEGQRQGRFWYLSDTLLSTVMLYRSAVKH